jgi:hypothetical protein
LRSTHAELELGAPSDRESGIINPHVVMPAQAGIHVDFREFADG